MSSVDDVNGAVGPDPVLIRSPGRSGSSLTVDREGGPMVIRRPDQHREGGGQNRGRASTRRHHRSTGPAGGRLPRSQGGRPAGGDSALGWTGDRRGRAGGGA